MVDAAIVHGENQQGYFFSGRRYARVKWTSYGSTEEIVFGPKQIKDYWPATTKAGFGRVDGAVSVPGTKDEFYFFFGALVIRIKFSPGGDDTLLEGPLKITDKWKSLASTPFDTIDAAINLPGSSTETYLFSGTHSIRIDLGKDKIIYGPYTLVDQWPGLTSAGFTAIDAAIPVPDAKVEGEHYVFKGSQYVRIQVIPGAADKLTWGPKPIADYWKTLDWS
ncbi:uncharacterized protein N7496_011076 [Penicillium cataractarum]|uniref:Hemopexin n=1 Tax=Penicillium cataractarum TaxID=2100454 RepID=A0A9W9RJG3_9EURO|nr:uncharacterized protein N7496_011076 [Penicillium cataractarum]KAJ5358663.1 hypothetical protein N7496_011076 [Penicillium cataractarum]